MNRQEIIEMMQPLSNRITYLEECLYEKINKKDLEDYKTTIRTYIANAIETNNRKGNVTINKKK